MLIATPSHARRTMESEAQQRLTQDLALRLRRRLVAGPYAAALETLNLLRALVGAGKWADVDELLASVQAAGRVLVRSQTRELSVGSMVGRVLYLVRDAFKSHLEETRNEATVKLGSGVSPRARRGSRAGVDGVAEGLRQASLNDLLRPQDEGRAGDREDAPSSEGSALSSELKAAIMDSLTLYRDELLTLHEDLEKQATEYLHADSVILTLGASSSVRSFLAEAARKGLTFHVIVLEGEPRPERGHELARDLASAGISCTVVPDAAVFALMPRVSQVVIPTRAVLANGGLQAHAGTHTVALAAKEFGIPVVCVTGLYKICPLYPHDVDAFVELGSPAAACAGIEERGVPREQSKAVRVCSPLTDYVPPELVTLYVTEQGGHQPSYIYRLLANFYSHRDADYLRANSEEC